MLSLIFCFCLIFLLFYSDTYLKIISKPILPYRKHYSDTYKFCSDTYKETYKFKKNILRKFLTLLFLCFLIFSFSCNKRNENIYNLFRITDNLKDKNIIESPLRNLFSYFPHKEDVLTGKWKRLESHSSETYSVWITSTSNPILKPILYSDLNKMQLFIDNKIIPYNENNLNTLHWQWLTTRERVELRRYNLFNANSNGIILIPNQSFEIEKILPDDAIIMDLIVSSENSKQTQNLRLTILINDKIISNIEIHKKFYRIIFHPNLDLYKIKFINSSPNITADQNQNNNIIIRMIKFKSDKDIIYLYKPKSKNINKYKSKIKYKTYKSSSKDIKNLLNLYSFIYNDDYSNEIFEKNPYSIIKKIYSNQESKIVLLSPSITKIQIKIKIPKNCILEFGYGFLRNKNSNNIKIKFITKIKTKSKTAEIFSSIQQSNNLQNFKYKNINLNKFAGKNVIIEFISQQIDTNLNDYSTIPVWINPILYTHNTKPNIILISIDTLRADHLGCYGYKRDTSPNIDSFAKEAIVFKNAYSSTAWTLPAHVSLFTALSTNKHNVYLSFQKIPPNIKLLTNYLRQKQYYTAAFTGGGYVGYNYGFGKGFDFYKDFDTKGDLALCSDEADILYKLAEKWLEKNQNKKFFLFLHTYQPHDPYLNPSNLKKLFSNKNDKWNEIFLSRIFANVNRYQTNFSEQEKNNIINLYDSEIRYTDEYFIKPLLKKLKDLNLYDNSLIIILSDHGEEFYDHNSWLHGHTLYNEAIKIPLIIKFPKKSIKNKEINTTVNLIDLMPTILDYSDISYKSTTIDGKSLLEIVKGKNKRDRTFISDLAFNDIKNIYPIAVTTKMNNYKLIAHILVQSPHINKIYYKNFYIELFDIQKDPKEKNNLMRYSTYYPIADSMLLSINNYLSNIKIKDIDNVKIDQELYERLKALGYIH